MNTKFTSVSLKIRDPLEDTDIDVSIILKLFLIRCKDLVYNRQVQDMIPWGIFR